MESRMAVVGAGSGHPQLGSGWCHRPAHDRRRLAIAGQLHSLQRHWSDHPSRRRRSGAAGQRSGRGDWLAWLRGGPVAARPFVSMDRAGRGGGVGRLAPAVLLDGRWLPRHGAACGRVGGRTGRRLGCADLAIYREGHRSVLLVAAWHTAFNLTSATEATGAVAGTVTSMVVIAWAVWILRREVAPRPGTGSPAPVSPRQSDVH